MKQHWNRR